MTVLPKESYKTFQAAAREWIAEKPVGEDYDWDYVSELDATDAVQNDLGDPDDHREERMRPHDPLAAKPKQIKSTTPTAYEQVDSLFEKFRDMVDIANSSCRLVKRLISEVAVNKAVYPTEKVLVTLFATALYAAGVPMKVILSRVAVSRRSIMGWRDDWDTFIDKELGPQDDGPRWRTDPTIHAPVRDNWIADEDFRLGPQHRAPHKRT